MTLLAAIFLTAILGFLIASSGKKYNADKKRFDSFLQREMEANYTRKKEIEADYFYTADLSGLPFHDYPAEKTKLIKTQQSVKTQAGKKMLHFDQKKTNLELKLGYGIANLDNIIMYEENYNAYIRALTNWAEELLADQNLDDAVSVLEESVRLGSELSKSYSMLAKAYTIRDDRYKLDGLYTAAQNNIALNPVTKDRILASINELRGNNQT